MAGAFLLKNHAVSLLGCVDAWTPIDGDGMTVLIFETLERVRSIAADTA